MAQADEVIAIDHVYKTYGATKAVDDISFVVQKGEIFGMLGPNGAGKSTTIEMIEGLRTPDNGSVTVLGMSHRNATNSIKSRIGIQLQTTSLYPFHTVTELLDLFRTFYPHRKMLATEELIAMVDLGEKRNTRSKQLSGGQRQRLSVALALVNDPDIVFLDEPTAALDPQARRQMWDVLQAMQQRGKTVVLTTHYMEEAEVLCNRVAIVDHGKIIELDSPNALIQQHFQEIAVEFQDEQQTTRHYESLPGVKYVQREGKNVSLYTQDVPHTMAALLEYDGVAALQNLNVRRATLEDVFLKLTGRALRD